MNYTPMEQYWIWLSSVEGIGVKRFYELLTLFGDARSLWDALADGMPRELRFLGRPAAQNLWSARQEGYFYELFEGLERAGIRAIPRINDAYPACLASIYDPPATLYVRGECPLDGEKQFAIVGSRRCTRDGQRAAREMGRALAEAGVTVISGLARGVDTCAHRGALEGGGATVAVLGCGADVAYPPENEALMNGIIDGGGAIVSEYRPGTQPLPGNFPARNRIISGLARGTLIVEGARKSGAMITVNHAADQGRDVFAVPGSIYSPLSEMPNALIVNGAVPVTCPWDILEYYRWGERPRPGAEAEKPSAALEPDEAAVVEPLRAEELSFDELSALTGFSASKLNSLLTILELRGIIMRVPGGTYRAYLN